jgi:hypothetical protein
LKAGQPKNLRLKFGAEKVACPSRVEPRFSPEARLLTSENEPFALGETPHVMTSPLPVIKFFQRRPDQLSRV